MLVNLFELYNPPFILPTVHVHYVLLASKVARDTSAMKINTNDPCMKSKSYYWTQSYLVADARFGPLKDLFV